MAGKAGRFVCIFIPMLLTMFALVFMAMIGLGQTNANNNYLSNLYFAQFNTQNVTDNSDFADNPANSYTDPSTKSDDGKIIIQNFYSVGLWGFCAGAGDNTTRSVLSFGQKTAQAVDFCSARTMQYGFDPSQVWGLSQDVQSRVFNQDFYDFINNTYLVNNKRYMTTLYILAVTSVSIQILVGIGGLFSRLGSLFTTLSSVITTGFIFAFSLVTTLTYTRMVVSANLGLTDVGITMTLGRTMLAYQWLAFSCSFVGGLFWAFSSCCCSGRHRESRDKPNMAERTPYTYERVDEPFGTTQTINAQRPGGFEDAYRHGQ